MSKVGGKVDFIVKYTPVPLVLVGWTYVVEEVRRIGVVKGLKGTDFRKRRPVQSWTHWSSTLIKVLLIEERTPVLPLSGWLAACLLKKSDV